MDVTTLHCSSFFSLIISTLIFYNISNPRPVLLTDYALFKPPRSLHALHARFIEHAKMELFGDAKSVDFMMKILQRSGLGDETSLPSSIHNIPPSLSMARAREEAELVIFSCMDSLFKKTGLNPNGVDILISNCSQFCPNPSFTSMVINKYKMRSDVKSFSLGGMGCSASLISIDLAKDLLQRYSNSNAIVISIEILILISRMGGL